MARKGAKAKITAKQRAARQRNIKIAQASKKRGKKRTAKQKAAKKKFMASVDRELKSKVGWTLDDAYKLIG